MCVYGCVLQKSFLMCVYECILKKYIPFLCRRQRLAELKAAQMNARFGDVTEISKADYVTEVNNAGEGVWVVLHIYKDGQVVMFYVVGNTTVTTCCIYFLYVVVNDCPMQSVKFNSMML